MFIYLEKRKKKEYSNENIIAVLLLFLCFQTIYIFIKHGFFHKE